MERGGALMGRKFSHQKDDGGIFNRKRGDENAHDITMALLK